MSNTLTKKKKKAMINITEKENFVSVISCKSNCMIINGLHALNKSLSIVIIKKIIISIKWLSYLNFPHASKIFSYSTSGTCVLWYLANLFTNNLACNSKFISPFVSVLILSLLGVFKTINFVQQIKFAMICMIWNYFW